MAVCMDNEELSEQRRVFAEYTVTGYRDQEQKIISN